jgi:hypothetical protein
MEKEEKKITAEDLKDLYPQLSAILGREAVQNVPKSISRKGYDTTGYGYQFLVNRMNEILGISHWRQIPEILKEIPKGDKLTEVTMKVTIQIGNWEEGKFIPIAEQVAYGGHAAQSISDAYKGAHTNTLKKALGMFGVGKEAYEGTLDDDNRAADYRQQIATKQDVPFADRKKETVKVKILSPLQTQISKSGKEYGFCKVVTPNGETLRMVVFSNLLQQAKELVEGQIITITGVSEENPVNGKQILLDQIS